MKDVFIIEGKKYISSRRASEMSDYSSDYIGQLCRSNKLDCKMVGRAWFVTEESIHLHKATISREEANRNRIENLKGKKEVSVSNKKDYVQPTVSVKAIVDSTLDTVNKSSVDSEVTKVQINKVKVPETIPAIKWTITTQSSNGIPSPYIYSNDDRPLLPQLKKKEVVEVKKQEVAKKITKAVPVKISEKISVPEIKKPISESLIVKSSLTYLKLTREIILQRVIAPALVLVIMFGIGTGTYIAADKIENNIPPEFADSAKMVTANVYNGIGSAFLSMKNGYKNVVAFFTSPAKLAMEVPKEFGEVTVSKVTPNGIVLTSSAGSEAGDDALKSKIKGSFSDEVQISPDNSGTAGVITPVFKDTKGKDFVYVMVPVKDKNNSVVTP